MKYVTKSAEKPISMLVLISVIFCAFFGLQNDIDLENNFQHTPHAEAYVSDIDNYIEIANVDEVTLSEAHATLIRMVLSKKHNHRLLGINATACKALSLLYFVCLLFSYIYLINIRDSHRYIINYIHSTDGKKA